jgi:polysaccharide deacetylase 2 family uncharacterized protein YibQ
MKNIAIRLSLFVALGFGFYQLSFSLSDRFVHGESKAPATAVESTASELERLVVETLVPTVLQDAELVENITEIRTDDMGEWNSIAMTWQLRENEDPARIATRLLTLTGEMAPQARVYRSSQDALVEDLRIYVGKRLTHHLRLIPTLSEKLPPQKSKPTQLAIVVLGLGANGSESRTILSEDFPMSVGITPYSPFALRQSRDAIHKHKEVLTYIDGPLNRPEDLLKALLAVPNSTGVALNTPPSELPVQQLLEKNLYLLDVQGEIESDALRQASNAGVKTLHLDHEYSQGDTLRLRHLTRVSEGLIVTVQVEKKQALADLLSLVKNANPKEIQPVFLSELLNPGGD